MVLSAVLSGQITFSMYMEFVWRRDAAFLKGTKIRGVLRAYFTFSTYMEFVKWAKKIPAERFDG